MALTLTGNTLSKISFCDKQCSNVNDNKIKAQILQNLDTKYKLQVCTRDYNIINPNILRNVSYNQHILSTYTHGNPYMLYLTKIDGINCVIYIDKKLKEGYTYPKMHCVKYRFADELFQKDTIFTGEFMLWCLHLTRSYSMFFPFLNTFIHRSSNLHHIRGQLSIIPF